MKMIAVVVLALVAAAVAAPAAEEPPKIVKYYNEQQPEGAFNFGFETENGIKKEETGELKTVTGEDGKLVSVLVVRGSFSYIDNEGNIQTITYNADENGFRAEGPSIPTLAPSRR